MHLSSDTFAVKNFELSEQLHGLQKNLRLGHCSLRDIGSILPASVMVHDLDQMRPKGVSYMNNWGCERLGASANEINAMGDEYYRKYFIAEEILSAFQGVAQYLQAADFDRQYNFFQRVRLHGQLDYQWFLSVCKIIKVQENGQLSEKMMMLSSPVDGMDAMISRVNKVLDRDIFIKNNYRRFAALTKREKMIIVLLSNGKSSRAIADELFISVHTVQTHRKNIIRKTDCASFAALLKFAIAFDLV